MPSAAHLAPRRWAALAVVMIASLLTTTRAADHHLGQSSANPNFRRVASDDLQRDVPRNTGNAETNTSEPRQVSGVYPHLAMFNDHGECGTGAVVPWANRLWVVTYAPHEPFGSTDKLYEITPDLTQTVRPESIGGTPANRMIHRESGQLFIASYAIDKQRHVRVIPFDEMPGRLTATARHLTVPASKVYTATMEEGFYEVDVDSLEVTTLFEDVHMQGGHRNRYPASGGALLPGYHGKGLYAGQGRLVFSNNGEMSAEAQRKPFIPSGVLAEWDGNQWTVVRRNQFTEVTGPGGIYGNEKPDRDPLWALGWDSKSVLLLLLDEGQWHTYRLPKGSHSYDGAHGWNTEWPRIREIASGDEMLATMHGTFWRFPKSFRAAKSAGIAPRSNYLKVVGDFCAWRGNIVFGCDDGAASAFLNKKRNHAPAVGQSQSNLWFVDPKRLDQLGPPIGRGAVWEDEDLRSGQHSEPYLASGYDHRGLHLAHQSDHEVEFILQIDQRGTGDWQTATKVKIAPKAYRWLELPTDRDAAWIRLVSGSDCEMATAVFHYANIDRRSPQADPIFDSLAEFDSAGESFQSLLWAHGSNQRTLGVLPTDLAGDEEAYFQLDQTLRLKRIASKELASETLENARFRHNTVSVDDASVIYTDSTGKRWRFPRGDRGFDTLLTKCRVEREVVTERNLLNLHGTFYELPADNAGGISKVRPIASHGKRITDFSTYCGMLVMTGVRAGATANEHTVLSDDGSAAVWVGVLDDLWKLGKPRGQGGPWLRTAVSAGVPSAPYLMTGYDQKSFRLSHDSDLPVTITIQVDITGTGTWQDWQQIEIEPRQELEDRFPSGFNAYWLRVVASRDCHATAQFTYE